MTDRDATAFDPDAIKRKYAEERSKRMIEGRAAIRDLSLDEHFASYRGGFGDFFGYQKLLRDWRAAGDLAGLWVEEDAGAVR